MKRSSLEHARAHGYPTPLVLEVAPESLVLERIEGRTMLEDLKRRPWKIRAHAFQLAELHKRLHAIEAPDGLARAGEGDRLLHLDLHPENVVLSPSGPVVVGWTNARRGDPALDVALTSVIGATSGGVLGRVFLRPFLAEFDRRELLHALPPAAERRIADANVTDDERRAVRRLLSRTIG